MYWLLFSKFAGAACRNYSNIAALSYKNQVLYFSEEKARQLSSPVCLYCACWKHQDYFHTAPTFTDCTKTQCISERGVDGQGLPVLHITGLHFSSFDYEKGLLEILCRDVLCFLFPSRKHKCMQIYYTLNFAACFSLSAVIKYFTSAFDLPALFPALASVYMRVYFVLSVICVFI